MAFEGITCPHDGATEGITQVEPDTFYCSHHKGLFKYVDPRRLTVKVEETFISCTHCGTRCGRKADYGKCARCGELHCEGHYFTPDAAARVPTPYAAWALSRSGAGCEACLTEWAKKAEALLCGLLDAVTRQADKGAFRSLAENWPTKDDFPDRVSTFRFGFPPDWPLAEKFTRTARPIVGRVAQMLPVGHEVVQVQTGVTRGRLKVTEIWRVPAALLTGGMAITQRGDVFLESDKATYVVVIPSGKIPMGTPSPVLVKRGERIRLGSEKEEEEKLGKRWIPVRSGKCLAAADAARVWPRVLTAMAGTLP